MTKKQLHIRASTMTRDQIAALTDWWGCTITNVVQEAISRAWHIEHNRRQGHRDPVVVISPTNDLFASEAVAIEWLEDEQSATRTGPSEWITIDEDGMVETVWAIRLVGYKA